jgi:hypothetical protein
LLLALGEDALNPTAQAAIIVFKRRIQNVARYQLGVAKDISTSSKSKRDVERRP